MAHYPSKMRLACLISICLLVLALSACRHQASKTRSEGEEIDLGQNVTVTGRPEDVVFKDFTKNWRQFITASPELMSPVVAKTKREPTPQPPVVFAECVFSADAKGYVPQITITWNETSQAAEASVRSQAQPAAPTMRFDLALQHNGFERNLFSAALSTDKLKRFSLPSNSGLVNNPEAVLLTGPGLFPKLMDFRTENLQDASTNSRFIKQSIVLRDLSPGLSYTLRASHAGKNEWDEDRQFVFLPPVCPGSF
jgi:hypothetical protein